MDPGDFAEGKGDKGRRGRTLCRRLDSSRSPRAASALWTMPATSSDSDVEIVSRRVASSQPPSVLRRPSLPTSSGANPNRPRPAPHSSQDAKAPAATQSPTARKRTYKTGAWAQSKPSSAASTSASSGASGASGSRRSDGAGQAAPPSISAKDKELLACAKARLQSLADPKGKGKAAETVVLSSDEELLPIPSASSPRAAFLPRAELTRARHAQQRKGPRASLPSAPSKGSTSQLAQPSRHSLAARPRDPAPLQETAAVGDTSSESDPLRVHPVPPPSKARQKDGDPSRSSQTRSTSSSIAQLKVRHAGSFVTLIYVRHLVLERRRYSRISLEGPVRPIRLLRPLV